MTQGELEKIPIPLQKIFIQLEYDIMSDIVEAIKINGFSSQSTDYKINAMRQMGVGSDEIEGRIQDALKLSDEEVEKTLSDAAYEAWYQVSRVYKFMGLGIIPYEKNVILQSVTKAAMLQVQKECHNLSQSYGFAFRDASGKIKYSPIRTAYNQIIDKAILGIQTGSYSYDEALRRAVKAMTDSGIRYVDYESGVSTRADVAARRAIMTGFRQVQGHINEQLAKDLGTDRYEVSWHSGARPDHQTWQGKVYSYDQLVSVCGLGTVTGLHGANCYHDYVPFVEGLSTREYTDEWLEEQNEKENTLVEYNGKQYTRYQALQEQRRRERQMRAQRENIALMKKGGASKEAVTQEKVKYKTQISGYRDFTKKMDLPDQLKRIYQDGLGSM